MKRKKYIRLFVLVLVIAISLGLFSYVRASKSGSNDPDPNCDGSKCPNGKTKSEYILWESLTHNLLASNR